MHGKCLDVFEGREFVYDIEKTFIKLFVSLELALKRETKLGSVYSFQFVENHCSKIGAPMFEQNIYRQSPIFSLLPKNIF